MQSVTSVDTGNRPLNFLLNKGLLPWWNVLVSALNVPLMSLYGLEDLSSRINDALMHSSVQMEYQASKDLLPLERAWGLTMEIGPALDYAATWLSTSPRFQALARAPAFWVMGAGGIGGGIPVLSQSAPTALNETSALGAQLPNSLQSLEETVESSVSGWRTQEVEDLLQRAEEAGLRVSANGPESWTPRQIEAAIEYREVYNRTLSGPFHK